MLGSSMTRLAGRKVLILATGATVGGQERIACGLYRGFSGRGWAVRAIFPKKAKEEAFLAWCNGQGVPAETNEAVLDLMAPHSLGDMGRLRRLVSDWQPNVVNIHYGGGFISLKDIVALRAVGGGCRCVVSVHHPSPWTDSRKRLLTRAAAGLAHDVITFSGATREILLQAGVPWRKIHVVPCGLRPPTHLPSRDDARARLGFAADSFIIGCLSRIEEYKGIGDLIAAVARVSDPSGRLRLAVAGDGPDRARLEASAEAQLGSNAKFLGRVPNIDDFLACCDVFALPSYLEGFGLVYVEAAFHGVPSVGTLVGGVPDAVLANKTGLLVPAGDIAALAAALQRLRDDEPLRVELGNRARIRANSELTEDLMAQAFERVFDRS
jgi:glycosyltransferase involved in cell wall biosynthesis